MKIAALYDIHGNLPALNALLYDGEKAAQEIRTSGNPLAQEFAEENVLKVPTAAEATEIFERIAQAKEREEQSETSQASHKKFDQDKGQNTPLM
jgi:hypothetical protein